MRPMHIDFAPRSLRRVIAPMRPLHWLLAGIGFALCAGGIAALHNLTQQQDVHQAEQIRAQAAARFASSAGTGKSAIPEVQANAVNSATQQLNLPWSQLLAAVEHATPAAVALLELSPDAKRHLVKGVAEAKTADTMLAYIKSLKQQPFLGNVILTRHEVSDQGSNHPLRFEFEAEWLEDAQ